MPNIFGTDPTKRRMNRKKQHNQNTIVLECVNHNLIVDQKSNELERKNTTTNDSRLILHGFVYTIRFHMSCCCPFCAQLFLCMRFFSPQFTNVEDSSESLSFVLENMIRYKKVNCKNQNKNSVAWHSHKAHSTRHLFALDI